MYIRTMLELIIYIYKYKLKVNVIFKLVKVKMKYKDFENINWSNKIIIIISIIKLF